VRKLLPLVILVMAIAPHLASASEMEEARAKFVRGDFVSAAEQARGLDNVEAKVLATQAYLAEAGYVATGDEAIQLMHQALDVSAEALAMNPDHVEALLYRIIAIGYDSRVKGIWASRDEGLGKKTKALADHAVVLAPNSAWAQVVYSGWHAEIVAGAGSMMAGWMYGASSKASIEACEKAVKLEPAGLPFHVECARTLLRLSAKKYDDTVRQYLQTAMTLAPADRFEALVQEQGRQLLVAVETKNKKEIKRVFRALDAFRQ
jgi:hypothetical protein